jgi:hypothetical protein
MARNSPGMVPPYNPPHSRRGPRFGGAFSFIPRLPTGPKQIEMARPEMPVRALAVTSMPGRFLLRSGVIEIRRPFVHLHLRLGKQEIARTGKHSERQIPEKNGHDRLLPQTEPRRKNMDTKAHTRQEKSVQNGHVGLVILSRDIAVRSTREG